jgi:ERCC4-type nuclease
MANAMTIGLISPSETKLVEKLKEEVIISPLPEEKGADVLIYTKQGLLGIQRKEVPNDFLASITDGRLARETSLLPKHCKFRLVLLEGHFKYFPNGGVALGRREPSRFTKTQIDGLLFDIKYVKGVDYDYTDDLDDTIFYIKTLSRWMNTEKHTGLFSRPGGPQGTWAVPSVEEKQSWLLQGFEGVGPAIASSIISYFGRIPLSWSCSLDELVKVPKLSAKRAKIMWETLCSSSGALITSTGEHSEFEAMRRKLTGG